MNWRHRETTADPDTLPVIPGPKRYYDQDGEISREVLVLEKILSALERIEKLLQTPEQK